MQSTWLLENEGKKMQTTTILTDLTGEALIDGFTFEQKGNKGNFVLTSEKFEINVRTSDSYVGSRKLRVYVDGGSSEVDFSSAYAMTDGASIKGQSEEVDAEYRRLNRLVVKNMKAVILEAMVYSSVVTSIIMDNKFGYYKNAGCSCGCSGGFIADVKPLVLIKNKDNWNRTYKIESISIIKKEVI